MDVLEIARTVLRRWYVVIPVLLMTAGLAYLVMSTAESEYETSGSYLLTDSSLIASDDQLAAVAAVPPRVVAAVVEGDASRMRIIEQGGTADYDIVVSDGDGLAEVIAAGEDEEAAITTAQLVLEQIETEVERRQSDLPDQRRIAVEVLSRPRTAQSQVLNEGTDDEARQFVANGSIRFASPGGQETNPYAASFTGTIRILEEVLNSPQVRQEIAAAGGQGTYEVGMHPRDTAPIINISARSPSPEGAADTYAVVVERISSELRRRQEAAGVLSSSMLTLQSLSVPTGVSLVGGELRRPLIMIIGLGLIAAVSLAMLVEGLASRLRRGQDISATGFVVPSDPAFPENGKATAGDPSRPIRSA